MWGHSPSQGGRSDHFWRLGMSTAGMFWRVGSDILNPVLICKAEAEENLKGISVTETMVI